MSLAIDKSLTIAIVTPRMTIGGAETYVINKSKWLVDKGYKVIVISDGGENVKNLADEVLHIRLENIDVYPTLFKDKQSYKSFLNTLANILVKNKVDIVEAHNTFPFFYISKIYARTKIPFLLNVLNEHSYYKNHFIYGITYWLSKFGVYYTLTSYMNKYIEQQVKLKLNAKIIPIPVKTEAEDSLKQFGQVNDQKYILAVARLVEEKMYIRHLLSAYIHFFKTHPEAEKYDLIIIGDGPMFDELNQFSKEFNDLGLGVKILMTGEVVGSKLNAYFNQCDLYIGMGTTLLAAASYAKPILIPGLSKEEQKYLWGFWGDRDEDADVIVYNGHGNYKQESYRDVFYSIFVKKEQLSVYAEKSFKLFQKHYDFETIMLKWEEEYKNVINIFKRKKIRIYSIMKLLEIPIMKTLLSLRGIVKK